MRDIVFSPIDVHVNEFHKCTSIFGGIDYFAIDDYNAMAKIKGSRCLTGEDYVTAAIVDDDDTAESIINFIRMAVKNPAVKIIILQKPNVDDLSRYGELYLGRHLGWNDLKTGEKQITFGRFVDEHGNQIARDVVKRL
jgi:hypothetical protein